MEETPVLREYGGRRGDDSSRAKLFRQAWMAAGKGADKSHALVTRFFGRFWEETPRECGGGRDGIRRLSRAHVFLINSFDEGRCVHQSRSRLYGQMRSQEVVDELFRGKGV